MRKWILNQQVLRLGGICLTLVILTSAMILVTTRSGEASTYTTGLNTMDLATLYAIPSSDGTSLYIAAGRLGQLAVPVYANATVQGPTSYERSHTMSYDSVSGEYTHTFEGLFISRTTLEGTIRITTTTTSILGSSRYIRYYVPHTTPADLLFSDGRLRLLISANSAITDAYVLIMPTNMPPGDPPPGHQLIGQAYAIRASDGLAESVKPMLLRIYYDPAWLGSADPHMLSLMAWDAGARQWIDLGGTPFFDWFYLSQMVRRFTTYALMTTTTWRDTLDDISGLVERHNVHLAYGGKLELVSGTTSGWATSVPITPTEDFATWERVTYSATVLAGTTLTVSVLDGQTGEVLLSDVASRATLAAIDPTTHPSLRLQVTLATDTPDKTPSLEEWEVKWIPYTPHIPRTRVYMPMLMIRQE